MASSHPWWQETGACRAQAAHLVPAALLVPNPLPPTPTPNVDLVLQVSGLASQPLAQLVHEFSVWE